MGYISQRRLQQYLPFHIFLCKMTLTVPVTSWGLYPHPPDSEWGCSDPQSKRTRPYASSEWSPHLARFQALPLGHSLLRDSFLEPSCHAIGGATYRFSGMDHWGLSQQSTPTTSQISTPRGRPAPPSLRMKLQPYPTSFHSHTRDPTRNPANPQNWAAQ